MTLTNSTTAFLIGAFSTLPDAYSLSLVALSLALSIVASYTALDLAARGHVPTERRRRWLWLLGGAIAMGTGIWLAHFIAMMAFDLPQGVIYKTWEILLSLIHSIAVSGIALGLLRQSSLRQSSLRQSSLRQLRFVSSSVCLGGAIAWMHYASLTAMQMPVRIQYNIVWVALSVITAIAFSFVAVRLACPLKESARKLMRQRLSSALMMGLATGSTHLLGMAATHFVPPEMGSELVEETAKVNQSALLPDSILLPNSTDSTAFLNPSQLAITIGIGTIAILMLALTVSLFDRYIAVHLLREQVLQESEKRFRMLIREMQVGVLLLNNRAEILIRNRAAIRLLNSSDEKQMHPVFGVGWQLLQENGAPFAIADLPVQQAIALRRPIHDAVIGIEPYQTRRYWLLVNADPQFALDGSVERIVCTLSDITDQKQAETALQKTVEREQAIARVIQQMRQTLDLDTIFATTTQELRRALNCDRVVIYRFHADWSGEFVAESVAPLWVPLIQQHLQQMHLSENLSGGRSCAIKNLGTYATLSQDTYLQETQGGSFSKGTPYLCVPDIDKAGFQDCYLQRLKSFQARAYIAVPIFCGNKLWGLLASYQNSEPRQWEAADNRMMTQIGTQLGVAVQQAELFARTQQQAEELKTAKETADAANRAKTEFLANMSHELRTPLNAILGFAQLMHHDDSLSLEHSQYLDIISRSGAHLLGLINDILEMSKIEAGRTTLHKSSFNFYRLLDSLEEMLLLRVKAKALALVIDRASNVPKFINADESKLRQVLINLLGNAVKFTHQGSIILRVRLGQPRQHEPGQEEREFSIAPSRTLFFEVEDTGSGIAADELDKLFRPFEQTKTGLQSAEGSGLGLPISQKFVQIMGGEIKVSSRLGEGSLFSFEIQVELGHEPSAIAYQTTEPKILGLATHQPLYRILVVEDSLTNCLLLVKLLRTLGFEVQEAHNGQEAVAIWQEWQPHLIWMDIQMPIMNGYEATQRIKASARGQDTIIIALTASAFEEQRQAAFAAGCDDFVSKPFQREELMLKLSQYLGVEFLYESETQQKSESLASLGLSGRNGQRYSSLMLDQPAVNPTALQGMSSGWVNQLRYAASQCSDRLIFDLIDQIPEEHLDLAIVLTDLTESFRFDQIVALTEPMHRPADRPADRPAE
ncbi:MAG: response regulator [Drouetiella hepatica Uher 2000/2452]|uniref:Circadian input-output histidine kinase CikA n=1 Tax=Drouetiella hepatica Uher 2000/2452 TaxID=904376 RepID=A0A951UKE0_9CYAN|nr:response regulator [Drouetiella hepatica Uher 2000/2452]